MKIFNGVSPVKAMQIVRMKRKGHRSHDYIAEKVGLKSSTVEKVLAGNAFDTFKSMAREKFIGRRSYASIAMKHGVDEESLKEVLTEYKAIFRHQ